MTRARRVVTEVLEQAEQPLSAAAVIQRTQGAFDPVTVYRNLHRLEEEGQAESFVLHCTEHGTERFWTTGGENRSHRHWFHCEHCHSFTDLGDCALGELTRHYQERFGVTIHTHTLYFTGICPVCAAKK